MLAVLITGALISKGYQDEPAMQETRQSPVIGSLKIIGLLLMACYVCRFWPMLIFVIVYGIASIVYALVKDKKQKRDKLADILNACMTLFGEEALLLIRDEKVSAVHSGGESDYAVLPVDELLLTLKGKLDTRFPGSQFKDGYCDHSLVSASWEMPDQKEDLLGTYAKLLAAQGKTSLAAKLTPGIRFMTSDTGTASAKVSALLMGSQFPIHIGECVAIDHRKGHKVSDFDNALDQVFAQFGDLVGKLQKLLEIELDYPTNAMTRVCKKPSLPKKAAVEAIAMYEMALGGSTATAHDVYFAMQEIPFILKTQGAAESKILSVEENMARALTLRWSDYDLAKGVDY